MDITPLVNNLEILGIFKNKDKKKGDSIINALSIILRLLREKLEEAS